jgi:prepilin-type processing-associated H-X9-DG protein
VLLYENPANHTGGKDGMNILWGDGHVSWEGARYSQFIIKELQAGQNPPRAYHGQ